MDAPIESIAIPENGEKISAPEVSSTPAPVVPTAKDQPTATPAPTPIVPNVVDLRSAHDKTHTVDPDAQKLTKTADEEEEEFIKDVEEIHTIKP